MAEDGFDYSKLARPGEVKKTKRDEITPPQARQHEMEKPMRKPAEPLNDLSDLSPDGGIIQRRRRGRIIAPIPTASQTGFEENFVEQNQTRRGQTPEHGVDAYITETRQNGGHEPDESIRKKAIKYLHGRSAGIVRSAEARLRRQKPPTEH